MGASTLKILIINNLKEFTYPEMLYTQLTRIAAVYDRTAPCTQDPTVSRVRDKIFSLKLRGVGHYNGEKNDTCKR